MLSWYTISFYVVLNESYWQNNFNKMSVTYALKHAFRYSLRHGAPTTNIQNVKLNHKILVLVEKKGGKNSTKFYCSVSILFDRDSSQKLAKNTNSFLAQHYYG